MMNFKFYTLLGLMLLGKDLFGDCQIKGEMASAICTSGESSCSLKDGVSQDKKYLCTKKTPRIPQGSEKGSDGAVAAKSISAVNKIYVCAPIQGENPPLVTSENDIQNVPDQTRIGNFVCSKDGWDASKRTVSFSNENQQTSPIIETQNEQEKMKARAALDLGFTLLNQSLVRPKRQICAKLGISLLEQLYPALLKQETIDQNQKMTLNEIRTDKINEYLSLFKIVFIMANSTGNGQDYGSLLSIPALTGLKGYANVDFNKIKKEIETNKCMNAGNEYADIKDEFIPLMLAAQKNDAGVVTKLLEKGADVNKANQQGETALKIALEKNNKEIVKKLLGAKGIDVNLADKDGSTALMLAAQKNDADVVTKLLEKGADVNKANQQGETALKIALEKNNKEIVERLLNLRRKRGGWVTGIYYQTQIINNEIEGANPCGIVYSGKSKGILKLLQKAKKDKNCSS